MENTSNKLFESEYFLERMRENRHNRNAFKYNLSAFLAATRSVTLLMQKELKSVSGFEAWYEQEQDSLRRDPVAKFFLDARNITLHQEYVPTRAQVGVNVSLSHSRSVSVEMVVIRADGTEEKVESEPTPPARNNTEPTETEATIEWRWYFSNPPKDAAEKDIVSLCEEHIAKLKTLIEKCESKLGL